MKIINLEQGSHEWLSWRKTVITATDCPAILGSSPWSTAHKCWQKKLGLIPEQKSNSAMERGKRLEPIIRDRFIKKSGMNMTPVVVESSEYEFLGASLDGLSDCGKYILEVKTGNADLYKYALNGVVPQYYLDQVQQQLLVTRAEKCFYQVGSEDEDKDIVIEILPDPDFEKMYLPIAREFLKCIAYNLPPELQDSDYKDMSDDPKWKEYACEYKNLKIKIDTLEETKEEYRKKLLNLCGDQNCLGDGIKAMKTIIRGRIDYEQISEIKGMNLDKYRKGTITSWKVLVS